MNTLTRSLLFNSLLLFLTPFASATAPSGITTVDTVRLRPISESDLSILPYPRAATEVVGVDKPNDGGGAIQVRWTISPDDSVGTAVTGYIVHRSTSAESSFTVIAEAAKGSSAVFDNKTSDDSSYFYRVDTRAIDPVTMDTMITPSAVSASVHSTKQWFNRDRTFALFMITLVGGAVIYFIRKAQSGSSLYIRKIGGIEAVDEAIGRATEMGKKVFFIPGIQDMNDVQTIAGIAVLGRVAQVAAEYETWLEVPVSKSIVMVTARETVKEAYSKAGRPDSFQESQVYFITEEQFAYAASVDGRIVRERPATIFYMGAFFAESLILSETGNSAGAIQIAGTAEPTQLPFFVAACDFTLLGEELFAASAYLSREPRQLGSLKGQDVGKALFIIAIILGVLISTINEFSPDLIRLNLSELFRTE